MLDEFFTPIRLTGRTGVTWYSIQLRYEKGGGASAAREAGDGEAAEVGGQVRDGPL
eukprot:COSAG02_NODE_342_length_24167_cov_5.061118_4_plen_56_part_00